VVDVWRVKEVLADSLGSNHGGCDGVEALLKGVKTRAVASFVGFVSSEERLIGPRAEDTGLDNAPAKAFDKLAIVTALSEGLDHWLVVIALLNRLESTDKEIDVKLHSGRSHGDGGVSDSLVGTKSTSIELCSEEVIKEGDNLSRVHGLSSLVEILGLGHVVVVDSAEGSLYQIVTPLSLVVSNLAGLLFRSLKTWV
jgi:hypothetical protein